MRTVVNYRHAFHAGNFADLVKHAALTVALDAMTRAPGPLTVIDTHAGAGAYDLQGEDARRSGEAEAGIARLKRASDPPEAFDVLLAAVARANPDGTLRVYPGSPALVAPALRPQDRLVACELNRAVAAELEALLRPLAPQARALEADGFSVAPGLLPAQGQALVLIDPPFEARDDYARTAAAVAALLRRSPTATVMIWTPLKDLETFDGFLRALETLKAPVVVAETRLRPLVDPMRLNGCALVVANPPPGLDDELAQICGWVARELGDTGGEARIWRL